MARCSVALWLGRLASEEKRRISMSIEDIPLQTLDGEPTTFGQLGHPALLVVNVASECGLTPQYAGLQRLHDRYVADGFCVAAFPCNQFDGEEPGTATEIRAFCSTSYGVTFPMFAKIDVNGPARHPLYAELTAAQDADGEAGDVQWNFEKFLIANGQVLARFRPGVEPEDPAIVDAIEALLPSAA
jgi:glutathione peroxidase